MAQSDQLRALIVANDPRIAAVDYIAPIDIAKRLGATPIRRNILSKVIGDKLAALCAAWEMPVRLSPETRKRLFPVTVADYWVKRGGKQFVDDFAKRTEEPPRQGNLLDNITPIRPRRRGNNDPDQTA